MSVLSFRRKAESPAAPAADVSPAVEGLSYLGHFGLARPPFGLTPDSDFFFAAAPHREALNTLRYAVTSGEGFIQVTGPVGTGKTLLCRTLLASLPTRTQAVYLPNPALDAAGVRLAVAAELGLQMDEAASAYRVQQAIESRLIALAREDIQVVVVVDEAQAMPLDALETLRLLSNLETARRKLLTIVLFGQPELDARLDALPQLKTRIGFHDRLRPLTRSELTAYLAHRLARAGYVFGGRFVFEARAIRALHRRSGGVPRLVNVIAHKALLLAWGRGLAAARAREVHDAARDTLAARPARRFWWG
jgi:MSHA biogenesis protein MshM